MIKPGNKLYMSRWLREGNNVLNEIIIDGYIRVSGGVFFD